jgi:carbonic anhydrase
VLSQLNVLAQIEHLRTYPAVREMESAGKLAVHGWWFDIAGADVYAFNAGQRRFALLGEPGGGR